MTYFMHLKKFLYCLLIIYKLIIILFYALPFFFNQPDMDTDNTAKLIVFCNIVLCLPVDIIIFCTNYKDISYTVCVNFCMFLFFTPLIASCFIVDNIGIRFSEKIEWCSYDENVIASILNLQ